MDDEIADRRTDRDSAEGTRLSLVEAGLHFFGMKGFEAASTREIAAMAKANIASIGYHFGGKEGLRRACAEHVASVIRSIAGGALAGQAEAPLEPEAARQRLVAFVRQIVRFVLVEKRARLITRFMLRELAVPSITLDIVYSAVVSPTHRRLCALWGAATGLDPDSDAVKLAVFALVGQAIYFRIGQDIVLRKMEWREYGEAEAAAIADRIVANLEASLDRDCLIARGPS